MDSMDDVHPDFAAAAVVPGHSTWLARYCAGNHRPVWDEIRSVGVLNPAQRAAASQVADEMMNRVLQNLLLLTNRLTARGWKSLTTVMLEPQSDKGSQIVDVLQNELKSPLPPALAAFLHIVSSIDLIWNYNDEETVPELCPTFSVQFPSLDPLYVDLDNDVINDDLQTWYDQRMQDKQDKQDGQDGQDYQQQQQEQAEEEGSFRVRMSPNAQTKIGSDPDGQPYVILLPCHGADPIVEVGERVRFVDYLRDALSFGGFPGLKSYNLTDDLRSLIGELTEDFVDF